MCLVRRSEDGPEFIPDRTASIDEMTVAEIRKLVKTLNKPPEYVPYETVCLMAQAAERFYKKHPNKNWTKAKAEAKRILDGDL